MFDVAFSELVIIALVALIVIGPERLPKVARTAGILLGRLQRYVNDVKVDIQREIQVEELKKVQENVASQVREMEQSVAERMRVIENDLNQSLTEGIEAKAPDAEQGTAAAEERVAMTSAPPDALPPPVEAVVASEKPHA